MFPYFRAMLINQLLYQNAVIDVQKKWRSKKKWTPPPPPKLVKFSCFGSINSTITTDKYTLSVNGIIRPDCKLEGSKLIASRQSKDPTIKSFTFEATEFREPFCRTFGTTTHFTAIGTGKLTLEGEATIEAIYTLDLTKPKFEPQTMGELGDRFIIAFKDEILEKQFIPSVKGFTRSDNIIIGKCK